MEREREHKFDGKCPTCGLVLEEMFNVGTSSRAPSPGHFTLCFGCQDLLRIQDDMTLRHAEMSELPPEGQEEILRVRKIIADHHSAN